MEKILEIKNLNKSYSNTKALDNLNFNLYDGDIYGLVGANGAGKSTLLNMILEKENIWVHPNLKLGYFSQMNDILENNKSVLENTLNTSIYDETMTRIVLARLGFKNNDSLKNIDVLSDGEKAKVKLAKILTSDFNYLIFDEPTNFLDIRAIESLEDLLKSYDRPFIFVTHDEEFINNIANTLLIIENKSIISFDGNLTQYRKRKNRTDKNNGEDELLLDFRISSISSRLAMDIPKEERKKLEDEYKKLISKKKN